MATPRTAIPHASAAETAADGNEGKRYLLFERHLLFGAGLLYGVAIYLTLFAPEHTFNALMKEDRWIEGPGSLALLIGAVFFFLAFRQSRRRGEHPFKQLLLLGLAILFFFGFGEEISWGQRIFDYGSPGTIDHANAQDELTVHNLKSVDAIANPDKVFQLFWFALGVFVPVAYLVWRSGRDLIDRFLPLMPLGVGLLLIANQLMAWGARAFFDDRFFNAEYALRYSVFEMKESVAEVALAIGAYCVYGRYRRRGVDSAGVTPDLQPGRTSTLGAWARSSTSG